jgi:hypothetical protein
MPRAVATGRTSACSRSSGESLRLRLQDMIAANAEILRAAALAREQVRRELDEVAKGSKAVLAYARQVG